MTKHLGERNLFKRTDFGDEFVWGVSASALQTEGAHDKDGKGISIWDDFANQKKKILNKDSSNVAADFYHNYKEDIALIKQMGIPNFRFSISWPRILPEGTGKINKKGLAFYHAVIDECLLHGITPWVTLYHWDLPLTLQNKGGWTNREIIDWFKEYASICLNEYKDKVKNWMVLNEPMVFTGAGYFLGVHAPGKKGIANFLQAMHHAVLCQAIGFRTIKEIDSSAKVGTTYSCSYITPRSKSTYDIDAAKRIDALLNRTFIEPSLGLGYPMQSLPFLKKIKKYIKDGDEELMKVDFDFIGIQNYTREVVAYNFFIPFLKAKLIPADKRKVFHTQMDWEVYPEAIYQMIKKFGHYKGVKELYVTENGAAFPDKIENGEIDDKQRLNFINDYLNEVLNAKKDGHKIHGYFVWSLTDNFEWAEGYHQRFGLIHIDFNTQKRTIKNSGKWYANFLKSR